jgi:hypothetical protein
MMPNALSLHEFLQMDADIYFSQKPSFVESGLIVRQKIMDSRLLDLEGFESVSTYFDFCPQLFPTAKHTHLNGEWPRRGWQRNANGVRQSGCVNQFENGQWKCMELVSATSPGAKNVSAPVLSKSATTSAPKQNQVSGPRSKMHLILLAKNNQLPFQLPTEPWSELEYVIGPVKSKIVTSEEGLTFVFDLGQYESTQSASAICEVMAGRIPAPGPELSYGLSPKPRIKLQVLVPIMTGESERIVEFALAQTADLAIDLFRVGIASDRLLDPPLEVLEKFGLNPKSSKTSSGSASINWDDEFAGTKILFNL